ncbi:unnamed protein product [Closterium sp. Yama58-4]|nr:unnamed protein product [Closterium sp. Yama58-4]
MQPLRTAAAAAAAAAGGATAAAGGAAMGTPVGAFPGLAQPMGTRVLFSRSPTLLHFTIPPQHFSLKALPEIVFALFWTAFVAFWTTTAASSGAPLFFILFSIPFWAVGIGLLAHVLLRHIMDETVTVDPATCQVTIHRMVKGQTLPFFGLSTAHTALIHGAGVNYTMQHHQHDSWEYGQYHYHHHHSPPTTFCQLTMAGGETLSFGSRLSLAEQRWLSLQIASFLQVPWFQPPFLQSY